jgi:threonine aldolase
MVDRLSDDHANARRLAEGIHQVRPDTIDLNLVQSNMVMLDTNPLGLTASQLAAKLEEKGLRALPTEVHRLRFVTHRHITTDHISHALTILTNLLQGGTGPPGSAGSQPA